MSIYDELIDLPPVVENLNDAFLEKAIYSLKASTGGQIKIQEWHEGVTRLAYANGVIQEYAVTHLPEFGLELVDETYPYEVRLTSAQSS